jgi:hypothetical protein
MEAICTLAGDIAHDFNNILSAIFGYTELATMEVDPEKHNQDHKEVLLGRNEPKNWLSRYSLLAGGRMRRSRRYNLL